MKYFKKIQIVLVAFVLAIGLIGCETEPKELVCEKGEVVVNDECVTPEPDPDTEAPVISGTTDIAFTIGDDAPDYIVGITVTDNEDTSLTIADITVDSSAVDLATAGTYTVTFTVSDEAGNSTTESIDVVVTERVLTGEELATLDLAAIDLDTDFIFPRSGVNGTAFTWSSGNKQVITDKGYIIQPPIGADPVVVTITLSAANGDYSTTETFDITVQPRQESLVTSQVTLPFEGTSDEYVVASDESVNIFFVDNGTVPYIDIEEFILLLEGALESSIIEFTPQNDDELLISYDVEWEDFDGSLYTETYEALLDFTDNTFYVATYDFFESYVASTESDYGEGLEYLEPEYIDSNPVTIPLGDYRADLIIHTVGEDTYYLMPFHVADLVFAGGVYYDVYYNGDKLWGLDTFGISSGDSEAIQDTARTSSFNDLNMEKDLKEASYHYLALAFDYFYGLKMDQQVDTYYDFLAPYADGLIMRTDSTMYKTIFEIAYAMNDIHTSHVFTGYYNSPEFGYEATDIGDFGERTQNFYQGIWNMQDRIEEAGMDYQNMPEYRLLDNDKTAIVYLTGFSIDTPGSFSKTISLLPVTVENVVIDIAYNTGGNVGAVFRIFGYITEETFQYHSQNPADGSGVTYNITSDYVAYEYNWFFVTSGVTFSAGNIMANMALELGFPVMGKPTSGGASSIGVIMTPDGSTLLISTNSVTSTRIGNEVDGYEYVSLEFGVSPNYIMANPYDDAEILAIIEQHLLSLE